MANEKPKEPQMDAAAVGPVPINSNEILSKKAMDILAKATQFDLVAPDPYEELVKASANESGCWVHSPAMVQLFAVTDRRLTKLAQLMGMNVKEVERVHVRIVNGTQMIVIKPAASNDYSALPVNRYGQTTAWINIVSLLGPKKLSIKPGWRERFDVPYVPFGHAIGPGLFFILSEPVERRQVTKKEEEETIPQGAAPAEAKKPKRTRSAKAKAQPETAAAAAEPQAQSEPAKKEEGAGQE